MPIRAVPEWDRCWRIVAREWLGQPFEYGKTDCVQYADRYAQERGMPRAPIPVYNTALGATILVASYTDMTGVGEALLMRAADYTDGDECMPGDIVIVDLGLSGHAFAVRLNRWLALPSDVSGLRFLGFSAPDIVAGWHT